MARKWDFLNLNANKWITNKFCACLHPHHLFFLLHPPFFFFSHSSSILVFFRQRAGTVPHSYLESAAGRCLRQQDWEGAAQKRVLPKGEGDCSEEEPPCCSGQPLLQPWPRAGLQRRVRRQAQAVFPLMLLWCSLQLWNVPGGLSGLWP